MMTGLNELIARVSKEAREHITLRATGRNDQFLVSCRYGELRDFVNVWDACTGAAVARLPWAFRNASDSEVGRHIEFWYLHPQVFPVLTSADVERIVVWASRFEECTKTPNEMRQSSNRDLIITAYWAMADYARGQL